MATTEERLAKRKLDALKRGIHRVAEDQPLPFSVNIVGLGKTGADVVASVVRNLPDKGPRISALVVDVEGEDLDRLRAGIAGVSTSRADVEIIPLAVPTTGELAATLENYGMFLKLEYPMFSGDSSTANWLPGSSTPPEGSGPIHVRRAYAKALYGRAYYDGDRSLRTALRRFSEKILSADAQPVVCIVFGLAGGAGSGIMADISRHLSTVALGRAALTVGIGVLPCSGDEPDHRGSALFACLNELDCLGDEAKNHGVVQACGELFRNPFTAGFIVVPQETVWRSTNDIDRTHARVDREIADLLSARGGANLMEILRLLNWVAAPSTQHSAARTPWGPKWIHMLGFGDTDGALAIEPRISRHLGLRDTYRPEYIETRVAVAGPEADTVVGRLAAAFSPSVPPQVVEGGRESTVQFVLPCIDKLDLDVFYAAREAYDVLSAEDRVLDHSMLLDRGVVLSEPSTRLDGMAGASLNGGSGWVAVPYEALRGAAKPPLKPHLLPV